MENNYSFSKPNRLHSLFSHFSKRPKIVAGVIIILALSLPLVIGQVLRQQDIRQRASTAPSISFLLTPSATTVGIDQTFTVSLKLTTGTNDIGSLTYTLKYDPQKLQFTEGTTGTALQVIHKTTGAGIFTPTYLNTTNTPVTGSSLTVQEFTFKALNAGSAEIFLEPTIQATASNLSTYVPVDNPSNIKTTIILTSGDSTGVTLTPNPTATMTPTPTPSATDAAACTTETKTFPMNAPLSGTTTKPIESITFVSGGWCAWKYGNNDPNSGGRCPLPCPRAASETPNGITPITIAANQLSYNSTFDTTLSDNGGSCTYEIKTCNATTSTNTQPTATVTPTTPASTNAPTATLTPTPTNTPISMCDGNIMRNHNCACTENTQCRSNVCTNGTCAVAPKHTIPAGSAGLNLSATLPGIGQKTTANNNTDNPVNTSRIVRVQVFDSSNNQVTFGSENRATLGASLHFNPTTFQYEGPVNLGSRIQTGTYLVKLKFDNSLYKLLPGIVTITQGKADNTSASVRMVTGDLNNNNSMDIHDYTIFIACYQNKPACSPDRKSRTDFNDNGETDLIDLNILQRGFAIRNGD